MRRQAGQADLLEPLVLLRLAAGESVLGVSVHEVHLGRPRTGHFLLGDAVRPQPDKTRCFSLTLHPPRE